MGCLTLFFVLVLFLGVDSQLLRGTGILEPVVQSLSGAGRLVVVVQWFGGTGIFELVVQFMFVNRRIP